MNMNFKLMDPPVTLDCQACESAWELLGHVSGDACSNEFFFDHLDSSLAEPMESYAKLKLHLNQTHPAQIQVYGESRCEGVEAHNAYDYSIFLKVEYADGSTNIQEWAPFNDGTLHYTDYAAFAQGTHGWEKGNVILCAGKPVRTLEINLYFRKCTGRAWFRNIRVFDNAQTPCALMDTFAVELPDKDCCPQGLFLRELGASSSEDVLSLVSPEGFWNGIRWKWQAEPHEGRTFYSLELASEDGRDHALTLYAVFPVHGEELYYHRSMTVTEKVCELRDYFDVSFWPLGANGLLSRLPFAACSTGKKAGTAVGFDPSIPVFGRVGCSGTLKSLYLAGDIALTPEKSKACFRCVQFDFDAREGFRGALACYYHLYPDFYSVRVHDQGNWMAFVDISTLKNHEDFGFKFKEGTTEPAWDRAHGIYTFRYTEPVTRWINVDIDGRAPETRAEVDAYIRKLSEHGKHRSTAVIQSSSMRDRFNRDVFIILDRPWCKGAVWSINSMPGVPGDITDFKIKWNSDVEREYYTPSSDTEISGEYIDS